MWICAIVGGPLRPSIVTTYPSLVPSRVKVAVPVPLVLFAGVSCAPVIRATYVTDREAGTHAAIITAPAARPRIRGDIESAPQYRVENDRHDIGNVMRGVAFG